MNTISKIPSISIVIATYNSTRTIERCLKSIQAQLYPKHKIEIIVAGGYTPERSEVPVGKPTVLHFFRKDPSSCLEEVVISDLKIRRPLALNERTDITITPSRVGTLPFTCGMGMFHGTIIVK